MVSFTWLDFLLVLTTWSRSLIFIFSLSVTKRRDGRVNMVWGTRNTTVIDAQGIIVLFIDIPDFVQLPAGTNILGLVGQNLVLILQGLNMIMHLIISLAELIDSSVAIGYTPTKILLVIWRIKCIWFLTSVRLVPALGVTLLLAEDTISLGSAMAIGLLLFNISGFRL